jgi:RNA polymerase sigma factor (sigma-70 family)
VGVDAEAAYRRLAPRVLGYLRAQAVADPEDLLGEVFLQVARDADRFTDGDDPEAVRRWVFTIARHRVVDAARRARRRPSVTGAVVPDGAAAPMPHDSLDPELAAALGQLTHDQREVVVLRFVADLPLEAVAAVTRRRVGAVKALQHRALENLRAAVSPPGPSAL